MEKTSRDIVQHKIRSRDDKPNIKQINEQLTKELVDYLIGGDKNLSKFARLKKIYDLADKIAAINDDIIVCRKGCSYCCNIPVEITPLEANYIATNTNHAIVNRKKPPGKIGYCPLMDKQTAECTIYEFRPFNCRVFSTYDSPDYCRDKQSHWVSGGPHNHYGGKALLDLAYSMIEIDVGAPIGPTTRLILESRVKDIRQFFKRALKTDPGQST